MAADSDLEKTEPATPRRLEKAREEGQLARSRELTTFMMLAAGVAVLWLGGPWLYGRLFGVMRTGLAFDPRVGRDPNVMLAQAAGSAGDALLALLPVFALLAAVAVLGSILLGGLVFSGKAIAPQFGRMNLFKGVARLFSAQTLVELVKTLLKVALVAGVGSAILWREHDALLALLHAAPAQALRQAVMLVALCVAVVVASLFVLVLIDVPWQLFSHFKKLRMSREDVKQENKESEGDPHIKGQIRQQQRAMARRRMMADVPKADVVVTNPTHYAVALSYKEAGTGAPRVVAKGAGLVAQAIIRVAIEHRVPRLEAPPLARALHKHVEIGHEIPEALYAAVAQVLAWVYQLKRWEQGTGQAPVTPESLPVPNSLDPLAQADKNS